MLLFVALVEVVVVVCCMVLLYVMYDVVLCDVTCPTRFHINHTLSNFLTSAISNSLIDAMSYLEQSYIN